VKDLCNFTALQGFNAKVEEVNFKVKMEENKQIDLSGSDTMKLFCCLKISSMKVDYLK
jgi:hypothetical protein